MPSICILCLRCGLGDFSAGMVPLVALWIHQLPLARVLRFFGTLLDALSLAPDTRELLGLSVHLLHGIITPIGTSNFLLAFFDFVVFFIIQINKVDASHSAFEIYS